MPLKAGVCNSYCKPLRKCSWTVFSIDRQSFDRDKAAAVAQQCHSVVQSIERTVLTRQSFVSLLQSPDLSRVYKEVWESPHLVWSELNAVTMGKVRKKFNKCNVSLIFDVRYTGLCSKYSALQIC